MRLQLGSLIMVSALTLVTNPVAAGESERAPEGMVWIPGGEFSMGWIPESPFSPRSPVSSRVRKDVTLADIRD
jgi:formylglycine-generating enzyme required for sulfatase activity